MTNVHLAFDISGDDFARAGEASSKVKKSLKEIGFDPDVIRNVTIAMYEGEMNMVLHAGGGTIDVKITPKDIVITMKDEGPGIEDVELAMREGYSTAPDNVRSLGFGAGMGLPNIKKYSDLLEIDSILNVGTTLTVTFYL